MRHDRSVQRGVSLAGSVSLLAAAIAVLVAVWDVGAIATQVSNRDAPFGITLVADRLSAIMVVITGVCAVAVGIYALADMDALRERLGFHSFYHLLLGGICGAFVTGDIFNLYVWFEVMLISSFALLVLGSERAQKDGAVKYVAINLISTISFLMAIGLLYGLTGTLNMADLHFAVREVEDKGLLTTVAIFFMVGFGIKAAVFPLFFWLPASYHTPPVTVSAIFSALLTKVGVYAIIRTFTLIFNQDVELTHNVLLVIAALTMLTGVLGAAAQNEVRRILSFHIISQIGYMVLGVALYTPLGLLGAVFYLVHHIVVKANLFLVSGVMHRVGGSFELAYLGSLYREKPFLAILFLIPAFSLAGFPPLSGFWAKLLLLQASLQVDEYVIAFVALLVGLLTIYSMTKIWTQAFWKPRPASVEALPDRVPAAHMVLLTLPITVLAAITIVVGLWTEPFLAFAERAADDLLNPAAYLTAVLGEAATAEVRP